MSDLCRIELLGGLRAVQGDRIITRFRTHKTSALYGESLAIFREMEDRLNILYLIEEFAVLMMTQAKSAIHTPLRPPVYGGIKGGSQSAMEKAARLFGAADALREVIHQPRVAHEQAEREAHLAILREALGEAAFAAAWEVGRALAWEQAAAYALEEEQT